MFVKSTNEEAWDETGTPSISISMVHERISLANREEVYLCYTYFFDQGSWYRSFRKANFGDCPGWSNGSEAANVRAGWPRQQRSAKKF